MKIEVVGKAGDGVQFACLILAKILKDKGFEVAFTKEYSPWVRKGKSGAKIVFSKTKIINPVFEKADKVYDMDELREELNGKMLNMALLGRMLKDLDIKLSEKQIRAYLGMKFNEENLRAING